jgi:ribosomal-protein-alanine N-acetyltransferase
MGGFVLAREGGGEAEILTIAVNEKLGRNGLGWRMMQAILRETDLRGGDVMFLEVDGVNHPAIGLYKKLGFSTVAERKAYYTADDGTKSTALVMRLDLR